jgi:hypothetical protein
MSRMERTKLMELSLQADYSSLKQLGWLEVYEALKGWWPKRMSIEDLAPYLDALYGENATAVMDTLRGLRGEQWRPSPSSLYREMQGIAAKKQERRESDKDRYGKRKRPDEQSAALVRVRMLIDSGNPICACTARPTEVLQDRYHVLTCKGCGGLEQGQVFSAQDDLEDVDF